MPELPEVETVRRSLLPLIGARIAAVQIHDARLRRPVSAELATALPGRTFVGFDRRAKYLLCRMAPAATLLIHLGMSGTFFVRPRAPRRGRHDHIVFELDEEQELVFNDPRRFGVVRLGDESTFAELHNLGSDPLTEAFSPALLWALTRRRHKPIKNLLMDQALIAGIGNIYANEALFRAGVRPRRAAGRLRRVEVERLHAAVRAVLLEAIEMGGSSIADYRDGRGKPGYFQLRLAAYDRAGEPCLDCGTAIRRIVMSGRSTFYCARCQC